MSKQYLLLVVVVPILSFWFSSCVVVEFSYSFSVIIGRCGEILVSWRSVSLGIGVGVARNSKFWPRSDARSCAVDTHTGSFARTGRGVTYKPPQPEKSDFWFRPRDSSPSRRQMHVARSDGGSEHRTTGFDHSLHIASTDASVSSVRTMQMGVRCSNTGNPRNNKRAQDGCRSGSVVPRRKQAFPCGNKASRTVGVGNRRSVHGDVV